MTIYGYARGHRIDFDETDLVWRYADTGELFDLDHERPCTLCHKLPTPEGYDACLGELPGVLNACCGHGVEDGYIHYEKRPFWLTNKNRWPQLILAAGWLPFLCLTSWVIYGMLTVPDFGLKDYFGWWLLCFQATVVIWGFAHWLNRKQHEAGELIKNKIAKALRKQ